MSFEKRVWENRLTEYPKRRTLTKSDNTTEVVTVTRNEGDVFQDGDKFSAENMNDLEDRIEAAFNSIASAIIETAYPVGAIYMSVNDIDPATVFPNTTWERIKDRFLLCQGDTYENGATGGSATHQLTVAELPAYYLSVGDPGHAHGFTAGGGSQIDNIAQAGAMDISVPYPNIGQATGSATTGISVHSRGSNQAHNNMPPYLAVNVWKRVA